MGDCRGGVFFSDEYRSMLYGGGEGRVYFCYQAKEKGFYTLFCKISQSFHVKII